MKLRRFCLAVLAVSFLVPGLAWAQSSDEDKGTARALLIEGNEALHKKDYARAVNCFERADALFHAPTIIIGLARARAGLGKLVGAREAYNRVINETIPPNAPPAFLKAVEDAKAEVAALMPRVSSVVINVRGGDLSKVSATIDGASVPNAALGATRPADPGKHIIRVGGPGFETSEVTITLAEGKTETVEVELKPGQGVPPVSVEPGHPAVPGGGPADHPGDVPDSSGQTLRTVGWVSAGTGALGLITGLVTGGLALAKHGDVVSKCDQGRCPQSLQSDVNSYNTLGTISTAAFIGGGVLAAAGTTFILTGPNAKPRAAAAITPVVGLGYFAVRGTF